MGILSLQNILKDILTTTKNYTDRKFSEVNSSNTPIELPDNIVLYEQDDNNQESETIESLFLNNLSLESDDTYIYLKFGDTILSQVLSGGGANTIYCTGISIEQSSLSIDLNDTTKHILTAEIQPSDCTQILRWSSNNTKVVKISSNGELTLIGQGEATITASCGTKTDTITIKVIDTIKKYELIKDYGVIFQNGYAVMDPREDRATIDPLLLYIPEGSTVSLICTNNSFYFGPMGWNIPNSNSDIKGTSIATAGRILDAGWKQGTYTVTPNGWTHLSISFRYGSGMTFTDQALIDLKNSFKIEVRQN